MNAREFVLIVVGLVVGLAVGMITITGTSQGLSEDEVRSVVQAENAELRSSIVNDLQQQLSEVENGSAEREFQTRDLTDAAFFLVTMEQAESWLTTEDEQREDAFDVSESVTETINMAANPQDNFSAAEDIELFFQEQVNSADGVLANAYDALRLNLGEDAPLNVCLGLDNDPYSLEGPIIYLYLEVPEEQLEQLPDAASKDNWQELDGPREESMLWTAECYDPEAVEEDEAQSAEATAEPDADA